MVHIAGNRRLRVIGIAIYFILLALLSLLIFLVNDDTIPLVRILDVSYLVPVLFYAAIPLWLSYSLFLIINKTLNTYISFAVSIIIGIPFGLVLIGALFT